jgi:hypothetical protein
MALPALNGGSTVRRPSICVTDVERTQNWYRLPQNVLNSDPL